MSAVQAQRRRGFVPTRRYRPRRPLREYSCGSRRGSVPPGIRLRSACGPRPFALCCAISRMASTDSCFAESMNEQVLTTSTSAFSGDEVISAPALWSRPIMTSLSTRFLGQPRLTKPTLTRAVAWGAARSTGTADRLVRVSDEAASGCWGRRICVTFLFYRSMAEIPGKRVVCGVPGGELPETPLRAIDPGT